MYLEGRNGAIPAVAARLAIMKSLSSPERALHFAIFTG